MDASARLYELKCGRGCGAQPLSRPPSPPPPPPPPVAAVTRPSEGWTSTQPWPVKPTWMLSPEPFPIRFLTLTSVLIDVDTPEDHVIAACGSANVGAVATFSRTGGPSEMLATQPAPLRPSV